jgi:uncharacterized damage-inducible protein DinB
MTNELTTLVKTALIGELEKLSEEVKKAATLLTEEEFWKKPLEPGNSVGHLVLHLTGNLSHFVGAQLGKTGYVREREKEFTDPNPPSKEIALSRLDEAVATVHRVVEGLSTEQLAAPHPEARLGVVMSALMHLFGHFAMHRGQMSYIVRLVRRNA